jgi:hypothetical protein
MGLALPSKTAQGGGKPTKTNERTASSPPCFLAFLLGLGVHRFFLKENLPRFMVGEDLLNPVDPELGY